MIKTLITCGLSLLFLSGVLHANFHNHSHIDGYSICDTGCDDEKHHSLLHQCKKCLNENSSTVFAKFYEIPFQANQKISFSAYDFFHKNVLRFFSNSSAPSISRVSIAGIFKDLIKASFKVTSPVQFPSKFVGV